MNRSRLVARFIRGSRGRMLVVAHVPGRGSAGSVLIAPPFAEEMNKSRQLLAQLAEALADQGLATVLPDLGGTGDSEGEFADADWDAWRADLVAAAEWAAAEGRPVQALLGIRLGCALACAAVHGIPGRIVRTVFWAPVTDGQLFLTQFLRLRVAATMMSDGPRESTGRLRSRLTAGETVDVAGYALGSRLALQIEGLRLPQLVSPALGELWWIEVSRSDPPALPEAADRAIAGASATACRITPMAIAGEPFWASTEIVVNRRLLDDTAAVLAGRA
ncbi:MAG: hydrolase 2, exosortase A system-associated [Gammaproteobacteria bacterium]